MNSRRKQMEEAAFLYYKKNCTQQEIAALMNLSRQTVSKLLSEAIEKRIVEITIHNCEAECGEMEKALCSRFGIGKAVVCGVDSASESLRQLMTARKAAEHLLPLIRGGGKNIAISWGRTVQAVIGELPREETVGNVVFPLFGATDIEQSCYLSNDLARIFAEKIGARVKYAWFPYKPDQPADCQLFRKTSYYRTLQTLWSSIDIALVGIGSEEALERFSRLFPIEGGAAEAAGDIATHFFRTDGSLVDVYDNTLCACAEDLKKAKQVVAVAWGDNKAGAIAAAMRTGLIHTLITDEHTAKQILRQ